LRTVSGYRLRLITDHWSMTKFVQLIPRTIYCSATPTESGNSESGGEVIEQIIRPTGLVDPTIAIRPVEGQIDDLIREIRNCRPWANESWSPHSPKRMAEDLADYLARLNIRVRYLHSEIDTIEEDRDTTRSAPGGV